MRVDIWTDVACPHCYYSARNLLTAVNRTSHPDSIEIAWRSFQLFPQPADSVPEPPLPGRDLYDMLAPINGSRELAKAAMDRIAPRAAAAGLAFRPDRVVPRRTMNTHRMVHLAAHHNLAREAVARLYRAYWAEGHDMASHSTLTELMEEVGVPASETRHVLAGSDYVEDVQQDRIRATILGISGVPAVFVGGRSVISGAVGPDELAARLDNEFRDSC